MCSYCVRHHYGLHASQENQRKVDQGRAREIFERDRASRAPMGRHTRAPRAYPLGDSDPHPCAEILQEDEDGSSFPGAGADEMFDITTARRQPPGSER